MFMNNMKTEKRNSTCAAARDIHPTAMFAAVFQFQFAVRRQDRVMLGEGGGRDGEKEKKKQKTRISACVKMRLVLNRDAPSA